MAGYVFQLERALFRLASSPIGSVIGIETEDDIVTTLKSGDMISEQAKNALSARVPFSDNSYDLWNTLFIWGSAISKRPDLLDKGHFFFVTNKILGDCLARSISEAKEEAAASECAKAILAACPNPSEKIKSRATYVKGLGQDILARLVTRIELCDGSSASHGEALRANILSCLHILPDLDSNAVLNELSGWLQKTVMDLWRAGQPGEISRAAFTLQYNAIVDRVKREKRRERNQRLLEVPDAGEVGKHRGRTFVRQIELVCDDDDEVTVKAIHSFIRCSAERFRLSQEGEITDDDWTDFENRLVHRWNTIFTRHIKISQPNENHQKTGFTILSYTIDHRESLAGRQTDEYYLTEGTYHRLADGKLVGWHPHYKSMILE